MYTSTCTFKVCLNFSSTLLKNKHKFLSFKGLSSFIMREKVMQFRFFGFMVGNKAFLSSLKNGILKDNGTHLQLSLNYTGYIFLSYGLCHSSVQFQLATYYYIV